MSGFTVGLFPLVSKAIYLQLARPVLRLGHMLRKSCTIPTRRRIVSCMGWIFFLEEQKGVINLRLRKVTRLLVFIFLLRDDMRRSASIIYHLYYGVDFCGSAPYGSCRLLPERSRPYRWRGN